MTNSETVGRTGWDFLSIVIQRGIPWVIAVVAICVIGYIISHPGVAKEWNVFISTVIARIVPRKRKKTFERRIDLTLQKARDGIKQAMPEYVERFLPYSLQIEWVESNANDTLDESNIESVIKDKQIILYVPSYRNEEKQAVNIMYNFCRKGFAQKPKCYMKDEDCKATDLLITGKLAQNAGSHVFDYYNRVFIREMLQSDTTFKRSYDELKKIDVDGLFLPIFINEVDKYASRIYGSTIDTKTTRVIDHFKDYLLRIIEKNQDEDVELNFVEDGIAVHIELAVGNFATTKRIEGVIDKLEKLINKGTVSTIYILASGNKRSSANEIATGLEERVVQDIYEPRFTQYKRYTGFNGGVESICYEIDIRERELS